MSVACWLAQFFTQQAFLPNFDKLAASGNQYKIAAELTKPLAVLKVE